MRICKHGYAQNGKRHSLYKVWDGMKRRCLNPKFKQYKDYGGRGIKVCNEWINDPKAFIEWALANGWQKGLIIDRIENDGNYSPNNVRFVDAGTSIRNTRLLQANNISGYRGVCWDENCKSWKAQITINGKHINLGRFKSSRLAAIRYDVESYLNDNRPRNFIIA